MKKIEQIISLLTCALLMLAVAINRDGRVFGYDVVSEEPGENMLPQRYCGFSLGQSALCG